MACPKTFRSGARSSLMLGALVWLFAQTTACSGDIDYTFDEDPVGSGGANIFVGAGGGASGGNPFYGSGGAPEPASGGSTPYVEVECPEVPPPVTAHECDPLALENGCTDYESCIPYIAYPDREDGCGSPGYGEVCWTSGSGRQGDLCSDFGTGCDAGFMCVVGAAGGERCAAICVPGEEDNCPRGLICGETDVLGFGVCY